MTGPEKTVLDLVRLGLKGDSQSVRMLASRILREQPASDGSDSDFRTALTRLLLTQESALRATRLAARQAPPADDAASSSVVRIEHPESEPSPCLPPACRTEIDQLIEERRRPEVIAAAGLEPTRTVLLTGSPGVGKTMTARHIASSLGLPLVVVDLATVVSSLLGKTWQNLRQAFDYARTTPSVFLLDEFDALGKRRDDPSDVGELKRIVNVLLLELDRWPASTLLIAATNHPELLDRAIWRRFERTLEIPLPDSDGRLAILRAETGAFGAQADDALLPACAEATAGLSGSDLHTLVREAVRRVALRNHSNMGSALLAGALSRLQTRASSDHALRKVYCTLGAQHLNLSQRDLARELGISHVSVGKLLRKVSASKQKPDAG